MAVEEKVTEEFYNSSDYFDTARADYKTLMKSRLQQYRIKKLKELYTPSKDERLLDMGSAWGTVAFSFAPYCKEVIGVDFSSKAVEISNRSLEEAGFNNVTFKCAPAEKTELDNESVDSIICADLVEHLYPEQSVDVLREAYRVLKKDGKFVLWTPHRGHIIEVLKNRDIIIKRDVSHVDYKSMNWLVTHLKECGFEIERAEYFESHLPGFSLFEKLFLPIMPLLRRRIGIVAVKK